MVVACWIDIDAQTLAALDIDLAVKKYTEQDKSGCESSLSLALSH
jgi:hypothetical protein